ncbi:hypothetical protein WN51_14687 [Melipona quadrifasciata]|uniref:Uncharacterized protein n=1 Tax=Melipona quadrifasciata TaxID=166423 RepID=A0A0M9A2Y6_9HYME|nr:hypothetical protein WN51_14687 [Melipona quadrifasciata]
MTARTMLKLAETVSDFHNRSLVNMCNENDLYMFDAGGGGAIAPLLVSIFLVLRSVGYSVCERKIRHDTTKEHGSVHSLDKWLRSDSPEWEIKPIEESYRIEEIVWLNRKEDPRSGKQLVDANICNWRPSGVAATAERTSARAAGCGCMGWCTEYRLTERNQAKEEDARCNDEIQRIHKEIDGIESERSDEDDDIVVGVRTRKIRVINSESESDSDAPQTSDKLEWTACDESREIPPRIKFTLGISMR